MSYFPEPHTHSKNKIEVGLDLSNYVSTFDLKITAGADTLDIGKKADLASLKSDIDKSDIDKLEKVANDLSSLKCKVDKLDIGKISENFDARLKPK